MPLIYVNYPEGTIADSERDILAEKLTTIALDCEHLPSTPFVRSTTWIYFNSLPSPYVYNGGKSGGTKIISLEVNAFEGGLNSEDKARLIARFTEVLKVHSCHQDSASEIMPVYIILRDVKESDWGVFGDRITLEALRNPPTMAKPV